MHLNFPRPIPSAQTHRIVDRKGRKHFETQTTDKQRDRQTNKETAWIHKAGDVKQIMQNISSFRDVSNLISHFLPLLPNSRFLFASEIQLPCRHFLTCLKIQVSLVICNEEIFNYNRYNFKKG